MPENGILVAGKSTFTDKSNGETIVKQSEGSFFKWDYDQNERYIRLWLNLVSFKQEIKGIYINLLNTETLPNGNQIFTFKQGNVSIAFIVHSKYKNIIGIAMDTENIVSFYLSEDYKEE
jgi:hypothetical protein